VPGLPLAEGRAPALSVLSFNIWPEIGDTVTGDGLTDAAYQYADFRVSGLATPPLVCIDAQLTTPAFAFIVFNRKLDDAGTRCRDQGGIERNWIVEVGDGDSCQRLYNYMARRVDLDLDGAGDPYAPCRLNGADNPRLRVENLWPNKTPAKTRVAFLVTNLIDPPANHGGYEIRSETDAGVVTGNSTTRFVSYDGNARLWEYIGKAKIVANPFPMKLHMEFRKTVVAQ
jgi:hypothetical protein